MHLFIHIGVMVLMCIYIIDRGHILGQTTWLFSGTGFDVACSVVFVIVAVFYGLQEIARTFCAKQLWAFTAIHHNAVFRLLTVVFSASLLLDPLFWYTARVGGFLYLALLTGTWHFMFFLRVLPYFSSYVVIINEAIVKAVFPFGVFIFMQVFAFAVAMHSVFLQPEEGAQSETQNFAHYGLSLLSLGKLMIGLNDFGEVLEAEQDYLSLSLFFLFTVITSLLMINALIAVMTNRFTDEQQDRIKIEYLQKLSVSIYMEGIFVLCLSKRASRVGTVDDDSKCRMMSYRKVPSKAADDPSGMEHRLRGEFKRYGSSLDDMNDKLSKIERKVHTGEATANIKLMLEDHEARIDRLLDSFNSLTGLEERVHAEFKKNSESVKTLETKALTAYAGHEERIQELLCRFDKSGDDREKRLHIYHYK